MTGPVVRIDGLSKVIRSLSAVGVETYELKHAMKQGSELLADSLRKETPVDTGLLASTVRTGNAKGRATARQGGARPKHYARFVNYGTKYQPRTLYSRKALRLAQFPAIRAIERDLQRIIKKYNLD